ncbi:peptidoglycan-associated lipoprotein Pal [Duganella sp. LX20W]|uniref:Peptidoglycan-associated lipoprotein n=1 Tax=Rugamonas brunnea TaxID=2758569 RepID=A0A7W2EP74_9BURK|nr:peptidoglycan-associated lipoprotein Pal [Rugamonas brunnea]MBA5636114.1 peptidoglycan-associated lipoprotein Pal [Rugamonas brunnea]HJV00310.1 peptidoglycan-associated lipoprotein Pal [Burkholderiaceae bacterium]
MRKLSSLAFALTTAAILSACSTPVKLSEPAPVVESKPAPAPAADTRTVAPVETKSIDPLDDPKGVLANRSVYFDFDSYVVRADGKPVVENHSAYLTKNKQRNILIQGNTDERGGAEYNLALGQKRAEAVRKAMGALGVPESQIEAVSLGKEKPKAEGHDEAAWAQNRRADIVYK